VQSLGRGFSPPLLIAGFFIILTLIQPDFGQAFLMALVSITLIFIGGGNLAYISSLVLLSLPGLYYLIFKVGYRRERIFSYLNPWGDPQGTGFQLIQSMIAVGSGGLLGKGLGAGKQKLFYLPASYNDFIFSIIGEELGFIGAMAIVLLYLLFLIIGIRITLKAQDSFASFLGCGIVLLIGFQAFINMGVSIGLLPTKGLPLPFISYGGTALVSNMAAVGILLNIGKRESGRSPSSRTPEGENEK